MSPSATHVTWITQPHVSSSGHLPGAWVSLDEALDLTERAAQLHQLRGEPSLLSDEQVLQLPLTVHRTSGRSAQAELSAMIGPRFEPDMRPETSTGRVRRSNDLCWEQLIPNQGGRRVTAGALGWPSGSPTKASRLQTTHLRPHWPWDELRGAPPTQAGLHTWPLADATRSRVLLAQGALRLGVLGPADPAPYGKDWSHWAEHARRCAVLSATLLKQPDVTGTGSITQLLADVVPALGPGLALCGLTHLRALLPRDKTSKQTPDQAAEGEVPDFDHLDTLGRCSDELIPQLPRHEWRAGLMATLMAGWLARSLTENLHRSNAEHVEVALITAACGLRPPLTTRARPAQGVLTSALRRLRQSEGLAQAQRHLSGGQRSLVPARQRQQFLERSEIIRLYEDSSVQPGSGLTPATWAEFQNRAAQWWSWSQDSSGFTHPPGTPLPSLGDLLQCPAQPLRHSGSLYTLARAESDQSEPVWLMDALNELGTGMDGMDSWNRLLLRMPPGRPIPECTLPANERRRSALVNLTQHLEQA